MRTKLMSIAAFGLLVVGMASAQTPATTTPIAGKDGQGQKSVLQKGMMQSLNLTRDQKHQAKAIRQAAKPQAQPLSQQLKQNRQLLTAAVQAGDRAKIQQLATENGSLRGHLLAVRSESEAQFFALLTPGQKVKAKDLLGRKG